MAVDFGILTQIPTVGARYAEGVQQARAEQERNMLRAAQMEQMQYQRENMLAERAGREALAAERRRATEAQNALANYVERGLPEGEEGLYRFGKPGIEMAEARRKAEAAKLEQETRLIEYVSRRLASATPQTYDAIRTEIGQRSPKFAAALPQQFDQEQVLALARQGLSLKEQLEAQMPKDVVVAPGASIFRDGKMIATAPEKTPTYTPSADMQGYELAKTEGFKGTFFDYKRQLAEAGRTPPAPREPAAPTVTQIQDPTNPMQMITIDARRYAGGGVGSPGVIGASGKTVKAEADALKKEQAQSDASAILDTLKVAYTNLDRMRAIPSEQRGPLSNIASGIAATGVGQMAGRMTGTEAQTQRDIIASARNQLFAAVKNATGLSAQNLNSNVEFTTWLNSLTDPSRSIQSNQAILENMERFIASGGKYSARKGEGKVNPQPTGASPYQSLSNEELLRQLGVKPGGR